MRMGDKGELTVPKALRDRAGIEPGSEVTFGFEHGAVTVKAVEKTQPAGLSRGERLARAIEGTATDNLDLSTDEIMNLMRGDD